MPRPFSEDLRWRMVFQRLFYARTFGEIAANLLVSPKTVQRTCNTFYMTGDVDHCCLGRPTQTTTLIPHEEYIIVESLLENPKIQLSEIAGRILTTTGSAFSTETLCKTVHRLGFTRKKVNAVGVVIVIRILNVLKPHKIRH